VSTRLNNANKERRINKSKRELVERLKAEQMLSEPWEQLISVLDAIDEKVCVSDPVTFEILYANPAMKKVFGENVLGEKCYKVMQGLDGPCDFCTNPMIFGENLGKTHIWEFRNRKTGKWSRCVDRAIRWLDGRVVRFEMAIGIHDRRVVEEALQTSEEKFRSMVENLREVIYATDEKGTATYISPSAKSLMGYSPEEIVGWHFSEFVWADDLEYVQERFRGGLSNNLKPSEYRVKTKSGSFRWVRTYSKPNYQEGKVIGLQGVLSDITEYKEAEAALRERERELKDKGTSLEEVNAALRVLLKRMEEDKKELEDKVRLNVQQMIHPYLERLKSASLSERQKGHLNKLEANLDEIMSPFTHRLLTEHPRLTPAELQIANLLREGRSSKEIADDLGLSLRTIETHRRNIRNKLRIKDKNASLKSYLLSRRYT
jgi:PAS domain S-box-containing protein